MTAIDADDRAGLRALADLCGRLLLREANTADLELLRRPDVESAIAGLGIDVPHGAAELVLGRLAQEYAEAFAGPAAGQPPLASLWRERPSGDTATAARRAARATGLELREPADHLGGLLVLWARTDEVAPELAEILRAEHLAWGIDALQTRALDGGGFYADVARATIAVLARLTGSEGARGRG
jgi:TorA maturation chaperone TorD